MSAEEKKNTGPCTVQEQEVSPLNWNCTQSTEGAPGTWTKEGKASLALWGDEFSGESQLGGHQIGWLEGNQGEERYSFGPTRWCLVKTQGKTYRNWLEE